MKEAFGRQPVAVMSSLAPRAADDDVALVGEKVADLARGGGAGLVLGRPQPTAAFSRRDALRPGYRSAEQAVRRYGFTPMLRPVGGHLALYDEEALVLHHWAPHPNPRVHIRQRFELLSGAMADGLRRMGVDARVGAVPGEYCDGEFSVNDSGRAKLVGTGQRITRAGYLFSAVIMVGCVSRVREALTVGYGELGLDLRPETVGCVTDSVPGVTVEDVAAQLRAALAEVLTISDVADQLAARTA